MSAIYERLRDNLNWCVGIVVGLAALVLSGASLHDLFARDTIAAGLASVLLILTGACCFAHLQAVRSELDLIDSTFNMQRVHALKGAILPVGIGLSLAYVFLAYASFDIRFYAAVALVFHLFDLWGVFRVNTNLVAIYGQNIPARIRDQASARVLFEYYFGRPHLIRLSLRLYAFWAALFLGVAAPYLHEPSCTYAGYAVVIVGTLLSEIWVYRWRKQRDAALQGPSRRTAREAASARK